MEQAISFAWSKGKGIYAMKALEVGTLYQIFRELLTI